MNNYFLKSVLLKSLIIALFTLASSADVSAQADEFTNFKTTLTGKGLMLTNKNGSPDYAVLIEGGTRAKYDASDGGLKIKISDGSEVIVYSVDAKIYAKTKTDSPETIMKNFRAAHLAQIEAESKKSISIDEDLNGELPAFDLREGKDKKVSVYSSFWNFSLPGAKPVRRIYLAVIIGDSMLILRKDLFNGESAQEQSGGFVGALKTLTLLPPQKTNSAPKKQPIKPLRKKN